tara:strand:+ start:5801 stop:6019 length:219 start_codon:yes stop_codon:yes gene_type:complete
MSKKMKCPKCGTEDEGDFTVWKKGTVGFSVYFDGTDVNPDDERYTDLYFDAISCQCGHESQWQSDFMVEVRE